jgi:hypothetical protein
MSAAVKSDLAALRQRIRVLEGAGSAPGRVLPFGLAVIDAALPGGARRRYRGRLAA